MFRKRMFGVVFALVVVLVLLMLLKVYYVRNESWGWLFWNGESAYVFIGLDSRGHRFSYLGLAVEEIREIFPFGASAPTDDHSSVVVLHVSPDLVQRYSIDDFWLGRVQPFRGMLYAGNMLPDGGFVKWSGTHFEPTTPEEAKRYHEYAIKLPKGPPAGPSYDNIEGWSKRTVAGQVVSKSPTVSIERDSKVRIEVSGKQLTFVMNSGFISHEAHIDLIRPGQPPERIWHLDEKPHRVSRVEYDQIFRKR